MSIALYRKWRSQTFDEVIGQEHVTRTLRNALREGRIAHAYLFSGPRGTGKTSTARILAKALNCTAPEEERPCGRCPTCVAITEGRMIDLIEIDAASNNGVDDIRELRERVSFRPSAGRFKVYIIDEVHMLSTSAFNALLKTLEEPPPHARFVLATTEPHKIPATVHSRCQRFDFRRIPTPEIVGHLEHIVREEGFEAEPDALTAIARSAQGCMRDAVSLLDQMLSFGNEKLTLHQVQQVLGVVNTQAVADMVGAVAGKDVGRGLSLIHQLVLDGASLNEFCQQVVEYLRAVLLLQMTGDAGLLDDMPREMVKQLERQARQLEPAVTVFAIKRFNEAIPELKSGYQPQLPLELALIESIQGGPVLPAAVAGMVPAFQAAQPPVSAVSPGQAGGQEPAPEATTGTPADAAMTARPSPQRRDNAGAELLRRRWADLQRALKQQCGNKVSGVLNSTKDMVVGEDTVVFAFSSQYQAVREMVDTPETRDQVGKVFSQFLNRPVTVIFQTGEHAQLPNASPSAPDTKAADSADPLLDYAVNDLGAQVVRDE
ncbi:MAG: DNA polymerase III subunit gamma/tau [Caldilineaceae bacterium]|nr:DNA polymerase III subunit gamma/tau [Caldilineaceae bacterium]